MRRKPGEPIYLTRHMLGLVLAVLGIVYLLCVLVFPERF